jgi:hypothetical protein
MSRSRPTRGLSRQEKKKHFDKFSTYVTIMIIGVSWLITMRRGVGGGKYRPWVSETLIYEEDELEKEGCLA